MTKYFAGIGSRKTPEPELRKLGVLSSMFCYDGFGLRSGGAYGADSACEAGADAVRAEKQIFLPHEGFNGNRSTLFKSEPWARGIAEAFHPRYDKLGEFGRQCMDRNTHQILGRAQDSWSKFILCYTTEGLGRGGTGQAIRIANHYNIPVFDIGLPQYTDLTPIQIYEEINKKLFWQGL